MNIFQEVKFVKAKEPVVVAPTMDKAKVEKKKNVANQQVLNKPRSQFVVKFEVKGKSLPDHKEVQEQTMSVSIVDFKGTPDQIVIS